MMLALESAKHDTDRRADHAATKNKMPWIELVVDLGLLKESQHLRWRYNQATLGLMVFNDVESDSSQELA
jgi:hypothetical protein